MIQVPDRLVVRMAAGLRRATHPLWHMVGSKYTGDELWSRIERTVERVKERLRRVTEALNDADIPYTVI